MPFSTWARLEICSRAFLKFNILQPCDARLQQAGLRTLDESVCPGRFLATSATASPHYLSQPLSLTLDINLRGQCQHSTFMRFGGTLSIRGPGSFVLSEALCGHLDPDAARFSTVRLSDYAKPVPKLRRASQHLHLTQFRLGSSTSLPWLLQTWCAAELPETETQLLNLDT